MTVVGLVVLVGGRSDLIRGLRGDGRDEYWQRIDVHATALAGHVLDRRRSSACAPGSGATAATARPYVQLGAIAGVAYIVAVAFLRWRS